MQVGILIPTYRRPHDLARCLRAIKTLTRAADEVVVVGRQSDSETFRVLDDQGWRDLPLKIVSVEPPGVVQAMQAGLQAVSSAIVALTDDDAAPRPDWLQKIEAAFRADPMVAGVGGRDWLHPRDRFPGDARPVVGRLRPFGRVIGNHHLGVGAAREVDVLKGANCAYRTALLRQVGFDARLRGRGAQVHWELSLGLSLRRAGWKLIYDPAIAVDHYPAQRHDEDRRRYFSPIAVENATHNGTLVLLEHLPPAPRIAFLLWTWIIGTRAAPGVAQWLRLWPVERATATFKWRAAVRGHLAGWRTWHNRKPAAVLAGRPASVFADFIRSKRRVRQL